MPTQSSVSATWTLPIATPPIKNGNVQWNNHYITNVSSTKNSDLHFENGIILPGLINTHCHLELSDLIDKTKERIPFTEWADELKGLITQYSKDDFITATEQGLQECLTTGTTTIADVGFSNANISALNNRIRLLGHKELIGLDAGEAEAIFKQASTDLKTALETELSKKGMSAHAPFSCSPELIQKIIHYNKTNNNPFIMHLSESSEEDEHYSKIQGSMLDFLLTKFAGYSNEKRHKNAVDYCLQHNLIPDKSLMIHCNHITQEQLHILKQKECSISHCPRSRSFFGHQDFPFIDALKANINISIGTDSLASNYSLNMWEELIHLHTLHGNILSPETIVRMATINGAKALNIDQKTGSLEVDKYADFIVVKPDTLSDNPYRDILTKPPTLLMSVVNGNIAYQRE